MLPSDIRNKGTKKLLPSASWGKYFIQDSEGVWNLSDFIVHGYAQHY